MTLTTTSPLTEFDAEALYASLAQQIKAGLQDVPDVALVGIHSGGAWLAERLAADLQLTARLGFIDSSFYRDDYAEKGLRSDVKPSQIPFEVEGATIVLIDDVLYTGRTTRAAINELFDYGRPARIILVALADRGGRELPIAADFLGTRVALTAGQSLLFQRADDGRFSLSVVHA
ncbi:bifunctional pyr operon transcriptional regulator/uracil phosphoribosyltransferase PyrR [Herbaspirillum sp. RTI4]|uniref:bifunctional pyr operon transcriptional regulator/uracil phosphoribosyltransferase PyrR n=1 Tax=Herbaspirillum sp. RTI4 TaxID=3048640 RepID=UPI002AB4606A|nr:bifunctional pyr operon transcriptional regulator/uracil phosphoribosyltransferase PyrR [Herbaspirillum sp. RTI4]MDY7577574.1 bifunctional pyr operon transcriptional regulator/uracil phosphoribosyltransferase PyrR [Herbaspirillum sp. RTI4]MEA9981049.1 bifunctional pyr operon transcriptional regulator/uracil phosphoribosyltransferase PyrR [Herbaspirillum sp. RTI4]